MLIKVQKPWVFGRTKKMEACVPESSLSPNENRAKIFKVYLVKILENKQGHSSCEERCGFEGRLKHRLKGLKKRNNKP